MAAGVGDGEPVEGMVGDSRHHRIVGGPVGEADDAGGEGEQVEQPDHRQKRQQPQDIGLRLGAADAHQHQRRGDQPARHQQHQHDAARPPRLVQGQRLAGRIIVGIGDHELSGHGLSAKDMARRGAPGSECLNRAGERKPARDIPAAISRPNCTK